MSSVTFRPSMRGRTGVRRGSSRVWLAGVLAVVVLVAAGVSYRVGASLLEDPAPIAPLVSLGEIPVEAGQWMGQDLEIPSVTVEYMERNFADDYVSRRYGNRAEGIWADIYVVYCASRPGGLLGHQPVVCFPAHGWIHDDTVSSDFASSSGRRIECLIHRFHKPAPAYRRIVVLSFYVLNGEITLSERDFSGFLGRRPNISGNPARYVAQVQISSALEHPVRALASEMADVVLDILPDQHGHVRWPTLSKNPAQADGSAGLGR